jgi:Domain of unknown function (DUF4440)
VTGRRSFVVGFAAALAATAAHAQENPDVVGLREQLMALEQQSWAYMKARDRAGMSRLLAEDALWIFADGTRYYKTDVLFGYMPNYRLDSYEIEPRFGLRVISPDAAVLLYRVTSRGAARLDRTETSKVLASSLYVRRGGKWWSLLYQETPLP